MEPTAASRFGKDHWSLLAYIEHCCVNGLRGLGVVDPFRLRCNPARHPTLSPMLPSLVSWKPSYATRLAGFFAFADRRDVDKAVEAGVQLAGHDDWDCLDDLQAAGYVQVISLEERTVRMTPSGMAASARLRAHKAQGGSFADFVDGAGAALSAQPA